MTMPDMRSGHPPADLMYVLDGAIECGHISGGAHIACMLYGDTATMDDIINGNHEGRGFERTMSMAAVLEEYAQGIIDELPGETAAALRGSSAASGLMKMVEYVEFVATSAYEDAVWGGCMLDAHYSGYHGRGGRVCKKVERRLKAPAWIDRQCRKHATEKDFQGRVRIWEKAGRRFDFNRAHMDTINALYRDHEARRRAALAKMFGGDDNAELKRHVVKRQHRQKRRSTIRAAALASAVLGAGSVSAFARGEPVAIPAGGITIEASRIGSIHGSGHGKVLVRLYDDAGDHLSNLCVYQELPALDQLASLALYAQSGEIADVIGTGNLYNVQPKAVSNPHLAPKKPVCPKTSSQYVAGLEYLTTAAERAQAANAYLAETRDIWTERIFVMAYGNRWREATAALRDMEAMR